VLAIKMEDINSFPRALTISMCLGTKFSSKPGGPNSATPRSDFEHIIIEFLTLSNINLISLAQTIPFPKNIYISFFGDFRVSAIDFVEFS
jgi:hypothetical protein